MQPRRVRLLPSSWPVWFVMQWVLLAALLPFAAQSVCAQESVVISLRDAVDQALAPGGNTQVAIAHELALQARARDAQARSALLPQLEGSVSQSSQTRNLQALGIEIGLPIPGFQQPRFVGPFNVFDARVTASQTLLSVSAIRRYQAAKEGGNAARHDEAHARQAVIRLVALAYYRVQHAEAQLAAAAAALQLATELEALAEQQRLAGTGIALEVTRAKVQRSQAEQMHLARQTELEAAKLQLQRLTGLTLGTHFRLSDKMQPPLEDVPQLESVLASALGERYDLRGQETREHLARLDHSAEKWNRMPGIVAFGDYGASGNTPGNALATRVVGVSAQIPIFDGGRRDAQRREAMSRSREQVIRTRDLRQQVELEVRLALEALDSSRNQALVALEAVLQAEQELEQARRRYTAGVTGSLEITRAQSAREETRVSHIDALYRYHLARADYAYAIGRAEMLVP